MTDTHKSDSHKKGIEDHIKKKKRVRTLVCVLALLCVCAMPFLISKIVDAFEKTALITLKAADVELLQGEALPEFPVEVTQGEESEESVLDKKKNYTSTDLIEELKQKKGLSLQCKADPNVEGTYKIKVILDKKLRKKLEEEWGKKVELTVKDGTCTVKNPVGDWEQDKFKRYDGSYVTNDFVVSKGKTYYFNNDGVKVTGWQVINNATYCFDDKGVMEKSGWKKQDKDKYYLGDNGAALTGWQEIKGTTYYFDRDGRMATGEVYVGLALCKFDKNGKLVSKKDSGIDPNKPMVALTFDDGPGERTQEILAQLEKYNAHATFFMQGKNVKRYADVVKKMKEIGSELGNHSFNHPNLGKASADTIRTQIGNTNAEISAVTGAGATVMRPPYGSISDTLKANVGMPMIMWSLDTLDWKTRNAQTTIDTTMNNVKDGEIILLHDIHTESVDAALELIPRLQQAGYQLVTVSELAAAKGVTMENGGRYAQFR